MKLGNRISQQRILLNLSQQQLGKLVGVGKKTISNWERNITEPNAYNIMALARELRISTDKLLCFKDRRDQLEKDWQNAFREYGDDPRRTLPISISALEEYPYDKTFLFRAAHDEEQLSNLETDNETKSQHLHRAMNYAQRLLSINSESETAKQMIVRLYSKLGQDDMAIEQAYKCKDIDLALKFCLKGNDLRRHKQKLINKKLYDLLVEMSIREAPMIDASEKILNAIFPDGNYQNYFGFISGIYLKRAYMLVESGKKDAAVDTLKELIEIARKTDEFEDSQHRFTTPIFDLLDVFKHSFELSNVDMTLILIKREFGELSNKLTT